MTAAYRRMEIASILQSVVMLRFLADQRIKLTIEY